MSRGYQLPKGRRIHVYRSGDPHFTGAKVIYNPLVFKNNDIFLDEVSQKVPLLGAVRSIHTPNTGTEVTNLLDLEKDGKYVAAGPKGFISVPGGYQMIGKTSYMQRMKKAAGEKIIRTHRSKSRKGPTLIWVYCNGDTTAKAHAFPINEDASTDWNSILYKMSEIIKLPSGTIKKLYDFGGKLVDSVDVLKDNGKYVAAAANESFRPVDINTNKRRSRRKPSEDDEAETLETIHSPGMKIRVPKPVKMQKNLSVEDESQEEESQGSSPRRRRRSRSESDVRRKSEPHLKSRSTKRKSKRKADDPLPEAPLGGLSLVEDGEEFEDLRPSSNPSPEVREPSPEDHIYEPTGSYVFNKDEDGEETNRATRSGDRENSAGDSSGWDSGRGSLLTEESRPGSLFKARRKSRPSTTMSVDLDADQGGIFRAKSRSAFTSNAVTVLEDSRTKIEIPVDLLEAKEVMEEVY